jgi:hypothetical protein
VVSSGGDVIVRLNLTNVPLIDSTGQRFNLLERLQGLPVTTVGEWPVSMIDKLGQVPGRVCAIKKSRHATLPAQRRARRKGSKEGGVVQPPTLQAAAYIFCKSWNLF